MKINIQKYLNENPVEENNEIEMAPECTLIGRAIEGDIAAQIELNYQYNVAMGLII